MLPSDALPWSWVDSVVTAVLLTVSVGLLILGALCAGCAPTFEVVLFKYQKDAPPAFVAAFAPDGGGDGGR